MRTKIKIAVSIIIISLILFYLIFLAHHQAKFLYRDPTVLMNKYYAFKKTNPTAAKQALKIILQQDQNHVPALQELSQIYLKENNKKAAMPLLERLTQLVPEALKYKVQLAYVYHELGAWDKAYPLFKDLQTYSNIRLKIDAQLMLRAMDSYIVNYQSYAYVEMPQKPIEFKHSIVVQILLNYFYKIRIAEPANAKDLLALVQLLSPDNPNINQEMGYLSLQEKNNSDAIFYLSLAFIEKPSIPLALQLGYLYAFEKKNKEAAEYFLLASLSEDEEIKKKALKSYEIVSYVPTPQKTAPIIQTAAQQTKAQTNAGTYTRDKMLLDQFYTLKKINETAAYELIKKIIEEFPNNIQALKEGGYLALKLKDRRVAIKFFKKAYELTCDAQLAMQIAYLFNQLDENFWAYQYFKFATYTTDKKLELRAQNAMTNLSSGQTKVLPKPFFSETFFTPFTQSRFGLTVRPLYSRAGIEINNNPFKPKFYGLFRRTDDNKSENFGQVPQIYEDNTIIVGGGFQMALPKLPIIGYFEAGRAYDIVPRLRPRWRDDLRIGGMLYDEFGAKPHYFDKLNLRPKYYSTIYVDTTYFSRFSNNVITNIKTYQGFRIAQYKSSMLNAFIMSRVIVDKNRDFFNNIAEYAPGLSFVPSNRYNVMLRYELIRGVYLPVRRSSNPYNKYYNNRFLQLLIYVKL